MREKEEETTKQTVGKANPLCNLSDVPHLPLDSRLTLSSLYLLLHLLLDFSHLCFILLIQYFCEGRKKNEGCGR